jgi:hypothetical protein
MKNARQRRGQFIIISALLVAILIVSVGAIMYGAITCFKNEQWAEYLSIINQIRTGSQRLMEITLANFTRNGFENGMVNRSLINDVLNEWRTSLRKSFPGYGISIDFINSSMLLSPAMFIDGIYIPERQVYFIKCYWYYPSSVSGFYLDFAVNLSHFGFYGYRTDLLIYLNAEIDLSYLSQSPSQIDSLEITVTREHQTPVSGLNSDNFIVHRYDPAVNDWRTVNISKVAYQLTGIYKLTFAENIPQPYYKWLLVAVKDERDITTVSTTYSSIQFLVEKKTPTNGRPTDTSDEVYTLESDIAGQWYWNGEPLEITSENGTQPLFPPLPPLPIKQFRVNVTESGVNGGLVSSPAQYEIWRRVSWHGRLIDLPVDLANPYYKFNSTNRLVFQVKFPNLSIIRQRVVIYWLDDLDASPYQGATDLEYISGAYEAKTNKYKVEFIGVGHTQSPDYPYDYYGVAALLMKEPVTGLTFGPWNLHAFGRYWGALAEWRPYGQWQIKYWYGQTGARAVVRLIAVLNSTEVQSVYNRNYHSDSYYDTYAVAFITANVKYLRLSVYIDWKATRTDYGLWFASVMGKGGPKWYAFLNNTGTVAGPYTYNYIGRHREYKYPDYWGAHWNEQFGRGLIINTQGLQSLRSLDFSRTRFSETDAAPGGAPQGSMEFEAINCIGPAYTVFAGTSYNYTWNMWMYAGGDAVSGYQEVADYYWMFVESYQPEIIVSEE